LVELAELGSSVDRDKKLGRPRQIQFISQKQHSVAQRNPEMCRGSPFSIQQNTDQCMHRRKLPKGAERISQEDYKEECLVLLQVMEW